jgi:hypothetical protein
VLPTHASHVGIVRLGLIASSLLFFCACVPSTLVCVCVCVCVHVNMSCGLGRLGVECRRVMTGLRACVGRSEVQSAVRRRAGGTLMHDARNVSFVGVWKVCVCEVFQTDFLTC